MNTLTALAKNIGIIETGSPSKPLTRLRYKRRHVIRGKNNRPLTDNEIKRIETVRRLHEDGWTQTAIAKRFEMSRATVAKIIRKDTFAPTDC